MSKQLKKWQVVFIVLFALGATLLPKQLIKADVRYPEVTSPSPGNVMVSVDGQFYLAERDKIVARINAIRKEAYDLGFVSRYVPIKWSRTLEEAARTRAAEALITLGHERLSEKPWHSAAGTWSENLAWNNANGSDSFLVAIDQWYREKEDYINMRNGQSHGQTGHYESIISPSYTHMGLGSFDMESPKWTAIAQLFSNGGTDESSVTSSGEVSQILEVLESDISNLSIPQGNQVLTTLQPVSLSVKGLLRSSKANQSWLARYRNWVYPEVTVGFASGITWTSSRTDIATVDANGIVQPKSPGKTTITARIGQATTQIEVTIKTITAVQTITKAIKAGENPSLPTQVTATWSDGTKTQEPVTWAAADYGNRSSSTKLITVNGSIRNTPLPATARIAIYGIYQWDTVQVTTKLGQIPALPTTATATWTDGSKTTESVSWSAIPSHAYTSRQIGQFEVSGQSTKTDSPLRARVDVVVPIKASTPYLSTRTGIVPSLPAKIQVIWSDDSSSYEMVRWDVLPAESYRKSSKENVTVSGRLEVTHFPVSSVVTVHVISAISPVSVVTAVNQAPVLPKTVAVQWTDGSSSHELVTWRQIGTFLYSNKVTDTSFDVVGTVSQSTIPAKATVMVLARTVPLYRLYHPGLQVHLYTKDANEYSVLAGRGWKQEGIAWQTSPQKGDPVYRLYHPNLRVHLYTKDRNEYNVLAGRGWQQEGIAFRSFGKQPIYRLYHPGLKKHLYTRDANEYKVLATRGWKQEGIAFYAVK